MTAETEPMTFKPGANRWRKRVLVVGVLLMLVGFTYFTLFHQAEVPREVYQHFRNAERIEFCTIDPRLTDSVVPEDFGYGNIEGYSIVDRVFLKNQSSTINALVWADRINNQTVAGCFNPRHAIRDESDESNYLLICFECLQMKYSFRGESGTVKISRSRTGFFEKLVELHSMTRASDLRRN